MLAPLIVAGLVMGAVAVAGMAKGAYDNYKNGKSGANFIKQLRENQPPIDPGAFIMPQQNQARMDQMAANAQKRQAAQMNAASMDTRQEEQWRGEQQQLMQQMKDRAAGKTTSAAELTLRKAQEAGLAQARSAAVSAEGVSPAMALKAQLGAQTDINIGAGQQAAITRSQEQASAEGALGGLLSGARAQDIGVATTQAGFQQQANLSNAQLTMQQRQMNDQMTSFYMQQGFDRDKAQLMANMALQEMTQQSYLGREGIAAGVKSASMGANAQVAGGMMGMGGNLMGAAMMGYMMQGGGGAAASSDVRVKKEIKKAGKQLDGFMKSLKGYSYKYKKGYSEKAADERISPMAQDIEKTPIGKILVDHDENGMKRVNYGKGLGHLTASIGRLHERLSKIEKKSKK
jgi:hypothetical protein